jgi:demethylmenaquinone methyltransferase/2-methoxy-6-polyprenyl-1,4-benzoquinol methylase
VRHEQPAYTWTPVVVSNSRRVLPTIGQFISRSRDNAYNYLPASVMEFPDGEALAEKLRRHG